jgi:hypothetical protein
METCPTCNRNFPDDSLITVIIEAPFDQESFLKTGRVTAFTERRLCRACADEAGQGMSKVEFGPNPPNKKKWWKVWK